MTKSKITLITPSSQKFVIYLDPKKPVTYNFDSGKTTITTSEKYVQNKAKSRNNDSVGQTKGDNGAKCYRKLDFSEESSSSTKTFSNGNQANTTGGSDSSKSEKADSKDASTPSKITDYERYCIEKEKRKSEKTCKNISGSSGLETSSLSDYKSTLESDQQDNQKKEKEGDLMSVNTNKTVASETIVPEKRDESKLDNRLLQNSQLLSPNHSCTNKASMMQNLQITEPEESFEEPITLKKNVELESNNPDNEDVEDDASLGSIVIEEEFIKSVEKILEAANVSTRKEKFDDLLKNISVLHVQETPKKQQQKPLSIFKKGDNLKRGSSHLHPTSSFYHYRMRSKMEGLDFQPLKIYSYGEKGSGFPTKYGPQIFNVIRADCIKKGKLFEDAEFPATDSSLFVSYTPKKKFEWKRPSQIVKKPTLFVEGPTRFDVQQGDLGDCWLLAAIANLTLYERLFAQIVPDDQSFVKNYAGVFHFRFWQYGRWLDVVIDDRLPTLNGKLVFLHSAHANGFWSALLEKAYAKLHGSYEGLKGGSVAAAMEDLTGGVTETYNLKNAPGSLFKIILKAYQRWSLMGCSLDEDPNLLEARTREGLIRGHAYSITKAQYIDLSQTDTAGEQIPLLRLRNPWGNAVEWNGAWSDNSPEWQLISQKQKKELGLIFEADGEFWMSYTDFLRHFNQLDICNLNPDTLTNDQFHPGRNKRWVMSVFQGEWVPGVTAGGCRNFLDTFHHNPQYRITLEEVDEEDNSNKCTLIVALLQKSPKQFRLSTGVEMLTIGFAIYHLPNPDKLPKPLPMTFFKNNTSVGRSPKYINLREVSWRFRFPKGTYCIVPSTYEPNTGGDFLIRVFSERQNNMEENDQRLGYARRDDLKASPTPNEIKESEAIYQLFKQVAGSNREIDWEQLKEILDYYTSKETGGKGFSKDVCRSLIAMLNTTRTGKLNSDEFKRLWTSVRVWKRVFKSFDKKSSGRLTGFELREALTSAGYTINNNILNILMQRYGNKQNEIEFDDFIMCAVKLKTMIEYFKHIASPKTKTATFTLDDWIEYTVYT